MPRPAALRHPAPLSGAGLVTRRGLLALGAALALPAGCAAATLADIRAVNLDALTPDQPLLLGRMRLTVLGLDRTGDAFIRTDCSEDEVLVPPDGDVAWVVRRTAGQDVGLSQVYSSGGTLTLGRRPLLAPRSVPAAIYYFGTVKIDLVPGKSDLHASKHVGQLGLEIVDEREASMAAFVAKNPALAGRSYYDVVRAATFAAPRPPG